MQTTPTLSDLAADALLVQDACNLSGVVHGFSRAMYQLRDLLPDASTTTINRHPIAVLWASKIADLTRADAQFSAAYVECNRLKDQRPYVCNEEAAS